MSESNSTESQSAPAPSPSPSQVPPPRRPPLVPVLIAVGLLSAIYVGYSFFNPKSMAQWKWAAAVDALEKDNLDEAKKLAEQATAWDPKNAELRLHIAEMHYREDETTEARIQIEEAIALGKNDPQVITQAGFLLSRMGQHDGALMLADRLVDIAEKEKTIHMHQALNQRAYAIAMAAADEAATPEQIAKGKKDIDLAIEYYGDDASYVDTRGYLKVFDGDLEGAVKDFDAAIEFYETTRTDLLAELTPEQIDNMPSGVTFVDNQLKQILAVLYSHRAIAHEKLGNEEEAKQDNDLAESYGLDRKRGIW
ncbi:Tetratricopeptide repeat protein [Bremerella volcania]|uniref:Tetratricopeptide repeat protein n=1 Tax=Bremerella volcania TaxID=2527984 RepID=A0A518C4Y1_9BACT|nr:tetratricopeptide repeat protein [Bremerella volcania]QDU74244.1 Tetratricopeptide repeat protein [Bremerella volcania]